MTPCLGKFYDGETGLGLTVELHVDTAAETLRLTHEDLPMGSQYWPLWAIRALSDQARDDQLVMSLKADASLDSALITTARLTVDDPDMVAGLRRLCLDLKKKDLPRGTLRKVVTRTGFAGGAIALMIFVILPAMAGTFATLIPIEREVAWGRAIMGQMERSLGGANADLVCTNPKGLYALEAMTTRLTEQADIEYDLDIRVFDHRMINAFAAPGGQIVLMKGLIQRAKGPGEVAAVLGHEIGHVEARDVTRNALRTAGSAGLLSMVLGDFSGGSAAVIVANYTLNASYTREAEAQADIFALQLLSGSRTDADGMANFFDELGKLEGSGPSLPNYLASHPKSASRAEAARAFAQNQGYTTPILTEREWNDLRAICD